MLPGISRPARLLSGAAGLALVVSLLGPGDPAARASPPTSPDSLTWNVRSSGSRAGADLVWRGTASPGAGSVTIRVEYAGTADRHGLAVWPVQVWVFVAAADEADSFSAELSGGLDWRTGVMLVSGLVTDGPRAGAPVEQTLRLQGPQLAGTLTLRFVRLSGQPAVEIGLRSA